MPWLLSAVLAAFVLTATVVCKLTGCLYMFQADVRVCPCRDEGRDAAPHPRIHVITFADNWKHHGNAERLIDSAMQVGKADSARIYSSKDLDSRFRAKNEHILSQPRGGGYWLWKPYVIFQTLAGLPDEDILVYCDSAYYFQQELRPLLERWLLASPSGIVVTQYKPAETMRDGNLERRYSSHEAFYRMGLNYGDPGFDKHAQVWAGFVVLRKTTTTLLFAAEWLAYAQDEYISTDRVGEKENRPEFFVRCLCCSLGNHSPSEWQENRHDQTVLSLLLYKWGIKAIVPANDLLYNVRASLLRFIKQM
jgi:hypothetical protein